MSEQNLQSLRNNRAVLLASEAIGWLHMVGKAHPDFLRKHGGQSNNYNDNDKAWVELPDMEWSSHLDWWKDKCDKLKFEMPDSLTDFCQKFAEGKSAENIVGLLQAGHAMSSGIEKNLPKNPSNYLSQDATHMWLTTAFGHPVRNLIVDPPDVLTTKGSQELRDNAQRLLDTLQTLGTDLSGNVPAWLDWRDEAIGTTGWLRKSFLSTLAETRLPNNDVTLWDQSYIAAALFKAALAGVLLSRKDTKRDWTNLKQQTRWRVLTVGFGAEHYESRAVRIGDWSGSRSEIAKFFGEVCQLVEIDLAIGSLVYRDDRVLAFTFPGMRSDDKGSDFDDQAKQLKKAIESEVDAFATNKDFETPPRCDLSDSTRSFISMATEIDKARAALEVPIHRQWTIPNVKESVGHVCPVCQIRPSQKKDKQSTCEICLERRTGRLNTWKDSGGDTIWITEVADHNDRVALLTLHLDLGPWIDGSNLDSLRAQSIAEWLNNNQNAQKELNAKKSKSKHPLPGLGRHIEEFIRNPKTKKDNDNEFLDDSVLASLHDGFKHEKKIQTFFQKIVEDRSDAPKWDDLNDAQRAEWLTHQLVRKHASPGRIHRIWRTTEQFFEELLMSFREQSSRDGNRWRTKRIVLTPDNGAVPNNANWQDKEIYQGTFSKTPDAPLELLYRKVSGDFITVSNLARVLKPEWRADILKSKSIGLRLGNHEQCSLTIRNAKSVQDKLGTYTPLIVLEQSPERFRVLVPLSSVSSCIEQAMNKWRAEFARVWDRLPLRIGVVAFPRKTPYQAVVEAARNLEDELARNPQETWRVVDTCSRDGITAIAMNRSDGEPEQFLVPTKLPDGREDVFYS